MKYLLVGLLASAASLLVAGQTYSYEGDTQSVTLQSQRKAGQVDGVRVVLEASGEVLARTGEKLEKPERKPMSVSCTRVYDEKTLVIPSEKVKDWRSVRYYTEAAATLKKGDASQNPKLRDDRRLIVADIQGTRSTPFCPKGALNSDEMELLIAAGDSLPLDDLLPPGPVKLNDKWKTPDSVLGLLLGLEEIDAHKVETALLELSPEFARMELSGKVEGKQYGAVDQIEVKAKCRFNRKLNRIDWFAMRVTHNREIGLVEGGVDITALVQIRILPKDSSEQLTDAALKGVVLEPRDELCRLIYEPMGGSWLIQHDRSWFLTEHFRTLDVFHRVEAGQDLALCKISPLAKIDPAKRITLRQYQADVQRALGKNFGEFVEASEAVSPDQYTMYRVVVQGMDGDVPVRWFYYLVTDGDGHQAALAFHVDAAHTKAFGEADRPLVASFRFVEPKATPDPTPAKATAAAKEIEKK